MKISQLKKREKQQVLAVIFAVIIIATVAVIRFGVFGKKTPPAVIEPRILRKVEINFNVFDSPALTELELFQAIEPFDGLSQRDNPFLYSSPAPASED